jgi:hypothetical protein
VLGGEEVVKVAFGPLHFAAVGATGVGADQTPHVLQQAAEAAAA